MSYTNTSGTLDPKIKIKIKKKKLKREKKETERVGCSISMGRHQSLVSYSDNVTDKANCFF